MKKSQDRFRDQKRLGAQGYGVDLTNRVHATLENDPTGFLPALVINNKLMSVHSRNSATGEIIMTTQSSNRLDLDHSITRRKFLGTTALSSAALLSGGITSFLRQSASGSHGGFDFVEKSILELQAAMASGQLTSRDLTLGYINRIQSLNPLLNSVIETNPNAISIAQQ